jgi:muramoyltetrapeptide carboxypeptidase LdcA involved in peptidoglycan recycling
VTLLEFEIPDESSGDGCIIFLENCGLAPVSRAFNQFQHAGWFRGIDALVLGHMPYPKRR